jgi:hypothetical protein
MLIISKLFVNTRHTRICLCLAVEHFSVPIKTLSTLVENEVFAIKNSIFVMGQSVMTAKRCFRTGTLNSKRLLTVDVLMALADCVQFSRGTH